MSVNLKNLYSSAMKTLRRSNSSDDEFEILVVQQELPLRDHKVSSMAETKTVQKELDLSLQCTEDGEDVLVTITPPVEPPVGYKHTPVDIVLVVDVSGSMGFPAELPDAASSNRGESSGLSVLDLTKHAARTILENLNQDDRLAVVIFSNDAKTVQPLLSMTDKAKRASWKRIDKLRENGGTNLWAGIKQGLHIFETTEPIGNVQSLFVLTDGQPNIMCPPQGYVTKLQSVLSSMPASQVPAISTFGFSYQIKSDLLQSIAEVGRGNFAFIPDAGMIGTVFVHAVANLFSVYAVRATLCVEYPDNPAVKVEYPSFQKFDQESTTTQHTILHVSSIQYGQSRDIVIRCKGGSTSNRVTASLRYTPVCDNVATSVNKCVALASVVRPERTVLAYHTARHRLCSILASLHYHGPNGEYRHIPAVMANIKREELETLIGDIRQSLKSVTQSSQQADLHTQHLEALLSDLYSSSADTNDPHGAGQIMLALPNDGGSIAAAHDIRDTHARRDKAFFYERWGRHFLPSILHAHLRQQCNSFKDPGPLCYGSQSPLFKKCRDELDAAFDKLPAPKPSLKSRNMPSAGVSMHRYNSVGNPCFSGESKIAVVGGLSIMIEDVIPGFTRVSVNGQARLVEGVVKTEIDPEVGQLMCAISSSDAGNVDVGWITPWHPILKGDMSGLVTSDRWVFPMHVCSKSKALEGGYIYSLLLEEREQLAGCSITEVANEYTVTVNGTKTTTLGHGLLRNSDEDIRCSSFWGDRARLLSSVQRLKADDLGRWVSGGVAKNEDGEIIGFLTPEEARASRLRKNEIANVLGDSERSLELQARL